MNGFFFPGANPRHALVARGTFNRTFTNNSTVGVAANVDFCVPTPTLRFFGVGNSFPTGVDPARDATAKLEVRMLTKVTQPDGSVDGGIALDYGMLTFREPISGVLIAAALRDAFGSLSRFDELDGSFGFPLEALRLNNFSLGQIGPGDIFDFS